MSFAVSQVEPGVRGPGEGETYSQGGSSIHFKVLTAASEGRLFTWEQTSPPGDMVPPHVHSVEDEFIYLVEGELEVTIGESQHRVRPGDFVSMPRGVPHAIRMTCAVTTRSIWTVVPAGRMEELFKQLAALPPGPPDPAVMVRLFGEHGVTLLPPP